MQFVTVYLRSNKVKARRVAIPATPHSLKIIFPPIEDKILLPIPPHLTGWALLNTPIVPVVQQSSSVHSALLDDLEFLGQAIESIKRNLAKTTSKLGMQAKKRTLIQEVEGLTNKFHQTEIAYLKQTNPTAWQEYEALINTNKPIVAAVFLKTVEQKMINFANKVNIEGTVYHKILSAEDNRRTEKNLPTITNLLTQKPAISNEKTKLWLIGRLSELIPFLGRDAFIKAILKEYKI